MSWEINVTPDAPVSGYYLYNRMEGSTWQETRLKGDSKEYILQDLQCGTKYYCYVVAFNSAGRGNNSETISVKTDGNGLAGYYPVFLLYDMQIYDNYLIDCAIPPSIASRHGKRKQTLRTTYIPYTLFLSKKRA
ncbi:down syndrome cell adhesion molecule [Caerostris extrusa]|uniref:Down syndrome cell adhesion molecule n=1 Tax=Caerostris extrusa TaxID=172846 RepID=A0AAV4WTQ3_CAEEX|nr:down syndrome cell adhesion molecule [Caerostris extrusa]